LQVRDYKFVIASAEVLISLFPACAEIAHNSNECVVHRIYTQSVYIRIKILPQVRDEFVTPRAENFLSISYTGN